MANESTAIVRAGGGGAGQGDSIVSGVGAGQENSVRSGESSLAPPLRDNPDIAPTPRHTPPLQSDYHDLKV